MRRILTALLLLIILSGCSAGLKQRWGDFNAYYNTFYNAKISYDRGIRSMESQSYTINAERPIRIHRTPLRSGQADFEKAIEKAADILREHATSKWVDDALLLIGKSYFYQSQFFSAEQKFNEVLATTTNPQSRQEAVLWKGVIYLETNRINDGLAYLNAVIDSDEYNWRDETLAEIYLVIAQLHVENDDFDLARESLVAGLPDIRNELLRSRGYFLLGQLRKSNNEYDEALAAFRRVSRKYPEYQLIYLANVKQNEILREMGRYDQSLRNFSSMARDDKNFDQIGDLNYEIGRTLQYRGDVYEAFNTFTNVLYSSIRPPSRETIARAHYALAELYRYDFHDYRLAAAHYDTASRNATDRERLPEYFQATELAQSFGSFSRLSIQVNEMDSLLRLAALPEDEFEAVIERIRTERQAEYERQLRQEQIRGTTLVNVSQAGNQQQNQREFGFLNHRNPELVRQASEAFAALWDERPLVDNWRRIQAVRASGGRSVFASVSDSVQAENRSGRAAQTSRSGVSNELLNIDLSAIPHDSLAKSDMQNRLASVAYEIGNIFYLNLDLPDSALVYYDRAIYEFKHASIRPQAIYTKSDIFLSRSDTLSAQPYIDMLMVEYPDNMITERMLIRMGYDVDQEVFITDDVRIRRDFNTLREQLLYAEPQTQIAMLSDFEALHPGSDFQAQVFLIKAMNYIRIAMEDSTFYVRLREHNQAVDAWNLELSEFESAKEVFRKQLVDPDLELDDEQKEALRVRIDSTLARPDLDQWFPYVGAEWDQARINLTDLIEKHPNTPFAEQARTILAEIQLPESLRVPVIPEDVQEEVVQPTESTGDMNEIRTDSPSLVDGTSQRGN